MPILITAKVNGFRRCGIAHSDETVEYPDDYFTRSQLAELQAEQMLVVSVGSAKDIANSQVNDGAEKQITALKTDVKWLSAENAKLSTDVETLTKDNAELFDNVTHLTHDNAALVAELTALKALPVNNTSTDDKTSDDKPVVKGK